MVQFLVSLAATGDLMASPPLAELRARALQRGDQLLERWVADAQARSEATAGAARSLTDGFDLAFAVGAALCLAGAIAAATLLRRQPVIAGDDQLAAQSALLDQTSESEVIAA